MVVFLWDEFEVLVTTSAVSRALASIGWSKKVARRVAKERNPDLRDFYLHNLSAFRSYHLVYVDESGCDKRIGFRRTGWSPLGVTPVKTARFQREQRYQMLGPRDAGRVEPKIYDMTEELGTSMSSWEFSGREYYMAGLLGRICSQDEGACLVWSC
jgi:hypothetical protein